jgi:hypothetical protein
VYGLLASGRISKGWKGIGIPNYSYEVGRKDGLSNVKILRKRRKQFKRKRS